METITKSRNAMLLTSAGAGIFALGAILLMLSYALLSGPSAFSTYRDLGHAGQWLQFVGALALLAAIASVVQEALASEGHRRLMEIQRRVMEVGIAAIATLLLTIGFLVQAASTSSASTANVLIAIGLGIWGLLALARAAGINLAQQQGQPREVANPQVVPLWLVAAAGMILFAAGSGITIDTTSSGSGIASAILSLIGVGLVAAALQGGGLKGLLPAKPTQIVIGALGVAVASFVAAAVTAGLVFNDQGTLKGLRIGMSLVEFLQFVAAAGLVFAAWLKVGQLVAAGPAAGTAGLTGPGGPHAGPATTPFAPAGPPPGEADPTTGLGGPPGQPAPPAGGGWNAPWPNQGQ